MKIYGVVSKGVAGNQFFEADRWSFDKGCLTLYRFDAVGVVAIFPFENLIGAWEVTADANFPEGELAEKIRRAKESSKQPVNADVLSERRGQATAIPPGDELVASE